MAETESETPGAAGGPASTSSSANKVAESIEKKGEHSYYFAHSKKMDDLSQATFIEGDGSRQLACVGGMKKVETEEINTGAKVSWREDYAWGDEGGKVKVYVEFPEGSLGHPDVVVEPLFEELSFQVVVKGVGGGPQAYGVTNGEHRLAGKIVPGKCQWRFNSSKSRLTVTLAKADPEEGAWAALKKHVISQHTGWN
mmetsp:Transcript_27111/g.73577  ORF Transcript_27111/g.73577 Transcript_27111/m.73577 type:complete len:197 (-) Transcript_27111:166-756(-)